MDGADGVVSGSPLRDKRFATLWTCVAAAFLAQWTIPVAAQWFLVSWPGGDHLVPYVLVALTFPTALLAIPAGVMADRMDRRRLVICVQIGVLLVEVMLVSLAMTGNLRPWPLLGLVALLSCGLAATLTSLSSMLPDLVRTQQIPAASALLVVATNSTRVIGPVLGGAILAVASTGVAFAAALPATVLLLVVLSRMPAMPPSEEAHERWLAAAWSGIRFMKHSPAAVKMLARGLWFSLGIMGLLSLLPLLTAGLGATSAQLGLVLAMQGLGAVAGAVALPRIGKVAQPNRIIWSGFLAGAAAMGLAAVAQNLIVLGGATLLAGLAWTVVLATVQGGMQMYLPAWVRARGLAVLLVANFAGQAIGAAALGWIAGATNLRWALLVAAFVLVAGAIFGYRWPMRDLAHLDRSAVGPWIGPEIALAGAERTRQLLVRIQYDIRDDASDEFTIAMAKVRRIRLRTGGRHWRLSEAAGLPGRYYEDFVVASWDDHRQQMGRLVASDREIEEHIWSMAESPPVTHYALRVDVSS